jgi:hypothetical protein
MINLKTATEFLVNEGYIVEHKGKMKFTAKFYKEFKGIDGGIVLTPDRHLAVMQPNAGALTHKLPTWEERYITFLKKCNIPPTAKSATGSSYSINQFSQDGMKAYKKAIESGIDEAILILSTALYYNGNKTGFKQKIGNYMADGTWITGYTEMKESMEKGTVQEHIITQTKNDNGAFRIR